VLELEQADKEHRRAIELSPGYATAHHWYGNFLSRQGRLQEAITSLRRALELDPLSLPIHDGLGVAYVYARRYEDAIEIFRKAVELSPARRGAHGNLAETYDTVGRFPEALREWDIVSALDPDLVSPDLAASLRSAFDTAGPPGYWKAWVDVLTSRNESRERAFFLARAYAQLGRVEEAFQWLDRLIEEGRTWAQQVSPDPVFDPLRDDPRFEEILRKIGLA
jgi:pentatricopeptide repeat protein